MCVCVCVSACVFMLKPKVDIAYLYLPSLLIVCLFVCLFENLELTNWLSRKPPQIPLLLVPEGGDWRGLVLCPAFARELGSKLVTSCLHSKRFSRMSRLSSPICELLLWFPFTLPSSLLCRISSRAVDLTLSSAFTRLFRASIPSVLFLSCTQ